MQQMGKGQVMGAFARIYEKSYWLSNVLKSLEYLPLCGQNEVLEKFIESERAGATLHMVQSLLDDLEGVLRHMQNNIGEAANREAAITLNALILGRSENFLKTHP